MTRRDPIDDQDGLSAEELCALRQALAETGMILPTNTAAFGAFQAFVDAHGIRIPLQLAAMKRPDAARPSSCSRGSESIPFPLPKTAQNLAQAAREGREISQDVRERMTQDRENSERSGPCKPTSKQ